MPQEYTATLFMNGGSQAVRLPKECRFEGSAVRVRKEGDRVILEPVKKRDWPAGYWERLRALAEGAEDLVAPEPLPDSPYREAVLDAFDGSVYPEDVCPSDE